MNGTRLVVGKANVPIDAYDAIELLSQRPDDPAAVLLAAAARVVADQWNDPPDGFAIACREQMEEWWPQLFEALYELLGGGPTHPPTTLADCRLVTGDAS